MEIREGYVYHIKDEYFQRAKDDKLMRNKEHGGYRPALLCYQDETTGILWFVPLSSQIEKYRSKYQEAQKRYGNCLAIELGQYGGREAAFLLQNLFPVLPGDLDHVHLLDGEPRPVKHAILKKVRTKFKRIREITKRGKKVTFTNIRRLEEMLLLELQWDLEQQERTRVKKDSDQQKLSLEERISEAQTRVRQRTEEKMEMRRGPPRKRE